MITAVTVILSMPQYVLNFHAIFYPFCIIFYSPEPFSQPDRQIAGQSEQDWLRQDGWTVDYAAKTQSPVSQPDRQIAGQSEQDWLRQDGWTVDYAAKTQSPARFRAGLLNGFSLSANRTDRLPGNPNRTGCGKIDGRLIMRRSR